jgi:hypothetical protein
MADTDTDPGATDLLGQKDESKAKGGRARARKLSATQRADIARRAAHARWKQAADTGMQISDEEEGIEAGPSLPIAQWRGPLNIVGLEVPCYVLDNGIRVIGRTAATELLTGIKGGGALEKYLDVQALSPFINMDLVLERMIPFRIPEVEGLEKAVKGLPADLMIEICQAFVQALEASLGPGSNHKMTLRQQQMAIKASRFLSSCAKLGLEALIDEATGYQFARAGDALQAKLAAYLEEEMRKWEKTFPDELWQEFGRLTGWKGPIYRRPRYWGHLVMELIYEKLDADVATWLKENAPMPRHGQNYHQWLSGQYGLKKLVEHIWMIIGLAKACTTMTELRDRAAALDGKHPVQLRFYLPAPAVDS